MIPLEAVIRPLRTEGEPVAPSSGEKDLIYVAGCPDCYPLEYYDEDTQSYQGVIPDLLGRFAEQSGYELRYYAPGRADRRAELAANQQVDLVACPDGLDQLPYQSGTPIRLLADNGEGKEASLCLLRIAPDELDAELRAFFSDASQVSQRELTGLLVQEARLHPPQSRRLVQGLFGGLLLTAALLAVLLIAAVASGRRKLKKLSRRQELDPVTGIGNREYLERGFHTLLNDRNRILYAAFYFCFDLRTAASGEDETVFPRQMAAALQDCAAETDLLARVADNGFALLRLCPGKQEGSEWASTALERLRQGGSVPAVTVGVYPLKASDRDLNEILFRSLRAAQSARQRGADCQFFTGETLRELQEEQRFRADLQNGLNNREFQIYLQFYADSRSGRMAGAEALVFWEHPERGLLPSSKWAALLEREGLSGQLDGYVLERLCGLLDFLRQKGREDFFFLYGLSTQTLSAGNVEEQWKEILDSYQFERRQLLLGVPEGSAGLDIVRDLGLGLTLSDFSGDLAALVQPGSDRLCGVKLSGAFAGQHQTILRAAIRAAHDLDLTVLAEGADTEAESARLTDLGCDFLRGTHYAHPLPAWEAVRQLV